jgi:predicted negative regulator of RcsB-dependent stress response
MAEHSYEPPRAQNGQSSGGNTGLAVIVGLLVAAVAVIGWFVFGEQTGNASQSLSITIGGSGGDTGQAVEDAATSIGEAAQAVEGAAEEAAQ